MFDLANPSVMAFMRQHGLDQFLGDNEYDPVTGGFRPRRGAAVAPPGNAPGPQAPIPDLHTLRYGNPWQNQPAAGYAHPNSTGNDAARMRDMAYSDAMSPDMGPVMGPTPTGHTLTIRNGPDARQYGYDASGSLMGQPSALMAGAQPQAPGGRPQPPAPPDYSPRNLIEQANRMYGNWQQIPSQAGPYSANPLAGARDALAAQYQQQLALYPHESEMANRLAIADREAQSRLDVANQRLNPQARLEAARSHVAQQLMADQNFLQLPPGEQQRVVGERAAVFAGLTGAPGAPGAAVAPGAAPGLSTDALRMAVEQNFGKDGGGLSGLLAQMRANPALADPEALARIVAMVRSNPALGGSEALKRKAQSELYSALTGSTENLPSSYSAGRAGSMLTAGMLGQPSLYRRNLEGGVTRIPVEGPISDIPTMMASGANWVLRGNRQAEIRQNVKLLEALLGYLEQ